MTELNAKISNYMSLLSDKETRLGEYEQKVKQLSDVEESLYKQVDEQKQKNNVSG